MARVLLGVTGSVAAVRTPALYAALSGAGHTVRVVATGPSLHFFDPKSLPRPGRAGRPGLPRRRRVGRLGISSRRPGASHRVPQMGRPVDRRAPRREHAGEVRARPLRQLPDVRLPRLGLHPARDPRAGDEHVDVAKPRHAPPPPPAPRRPRRRRPRPVTRGPSTTPPTSSPGTRPGLVLIPPQAKRLACGDVGTGAMAEVVVLADAVRRWAEGEDATALEQDFVPPD